MNEPQVDANTLKQDLIKTFGGKQGLAIYRSLMTCTDRLSYANKRLHDIEKVIQEKIEPNFEMWRDTFDVEEPEGDFHESQWKIRMLATEAVQHLHSIFDPLACVVYWFNIPLAAQSITVRKLNFYEVQRCVGIDKKYQELLSEIAQEEAFFHIAALSNLAKHSQIVRPSFSHISEGLPPINAESAVEFESCTGKNPLNKTGRVSGEFVFPKVSISKFIRDEIRRIAPLFNELVRHVRSDLDLRLKADKKC